MSRVAQVVIGVDLGGTNVRAQAFTEAGEAVTPAFETKSNAQDGEEAVFDATAQVIEQAAQSTADEVHFVGLAIPGHVDEARGMIRWAPNFGETADGVYINWSDVPVREPLQKRTGFEIHMGNDANLAALGEYMFGVGEGTAKAFILLTLGTGIGGGVVLGPASFAGGVSQPVLLLGGNGGGVELGHILVMAGGLDCNSGAYGGLEAYGRRDAIIARALNYRRRHRPIQFPGVPAGDLPKDLEPKNIGEAADAGDPVAKQVFEEVGHWLGLGMATLINVFAPDVLAVGGNIAGSWHHMRDSAERAARDSSVATLYRDTRIVPARVKDSGMVGAATYVFRYVRG
jgi:glucokinase